MAVEVSYDEYFVTIPALGHDFVESVREDPTCGVPGYIEYSCTRCPEISRDHPPALGHDWTETRTEPTCTAPGSIVKSCSRCVETESEELPALDHAWEEFSHTDPTCTDPGSAEYVCTRCQFAKSEPIPALGTDHTWTEASRIEPTETSPGLVEYVCSTCGSSKTESLPVLPAPGGDMTMTELLAKMTGVFSAALSWTSALSQAVAGSPVLLLCVVIGFIGTGLILFKRLLDIS